MTRMRILVAVDGSDGSFEAIDQIALLIDASRDDVALYCRPPQVRVQSKQVSRSLLERAEESFADLIFAKARHRLGSDIGEKTHTILGEQDARRGILLAARQWSADVIVVGARGLNALQRLVLGSVSRAIVHESDIPVWVARPRKRKNGEFRVLLAGETPATVQRSAAFLERLAWRQAASFTVLNATPSIFAGQVPEWLQQQARSPDVEAIVQRWASEHDEQIRTTATAMTAVIDRLSPPLAGARCVIAEGEPAHLILTAAAKEDVDLIVLGAHQKRSGGISILGSVSEAVLNHAECSVLLVPHTETP
jgi:nucleotide-binding universal stress UspA family protein